jgi:CMP-N,N'-diacetyllegionaminic acid synthase
MIRGETLTAVIPARAGSKGIPNKNLYRIGEETLVERAIHLAKGSDKIDQVYVTTDSPGIYDLAKQLDAAPPSLRPAELAGDHALTVDAIKHLVDDAGVTGGYILLLQVTTPLRTSEDLEHLLDSFENSPHAEGITSVVEHNAPHPVKMMKKDGDYLRSYTSDNPSVPRQRLEQVYALNGAFYLTSLKNILEKSTLLPPRTIAFEMPAERSVNLDGPLDLLLLEALIQKGNADI